MAIASNLLKCYVGITAILLEERHFLNIDGPHDYIPCKGDRENRAENQNDVNLWICEVILQPCDESPNEDGDEGEEKEVNEEGKQLPIL